MKLCTQRGGQLAGTLEIQPGHGILQFRNLQHFGHGPGAAQDGIHGIGIKLPPEFHQLVVSQGALGTGDGRSPNGKAGCRVAVAVAGSQHRYRVSKLLFLDVRTDLPQHHAEQIQLLEPNRLIGRHQHSAPFGQAHQMLFGFDFGGGNGRALGHILQRLVIIRGDGVDGAVVHRVDNRGSCHNGGQDISFLHTLPHGSGDVLRKEYRRIHGGEKLLHRRRTGALGPDAEALELPLEGIRTLQRGAAVVFAGVQRFQHLGKAHTLLAVHPLFQSQIVITHSNLPPEKYMVPGSFRQLPVKSCIRFR